MPPYTGHHSHRRAHVGFAASHSQYLATDANLTQKATLCILELTHTTSNSINVLAAPIHCGRSAWEQGTRGTILEDEATETDLPTWRTFRA